MQRAGRLLLFGGTVLVVAGAAPAWLVVDLLGETLAVSGVAAFGRVDPVFNGVVTALLAAVAVLLGLRETPASLAGAAVAGLLVVGVAGVYLLDPGLAYGDDLAATLTTVGPGVYVTVVGGATISVGGCLGALERRDPGGVTRESDVPHD